MVKNNLQFKYKGNIMKYLIMITTLLLSFGGCGNDSTTAVASTKALEALQAKTRPEDARYIAAWDKDENVELYIAGGADSSRFEIINTATDALLRFKNDSTPPYIEGGKNSYKVVVNAKDNSTNIIKRIGTYNVKVPRPTNILDTTPPTITTASTLHLTDLNDVVTLTATDNVTLSNDILFSIPSGESQFTLSGAVLKPAFTSGAHSVVITATDAAGNKADKTVTIDVAISTTVGFAMSNVENSATPWDKAVSACTEMGTGWRLPTIIELQENNETIFNDKVVGIDSDFDQSNGTHFTSVLWSSTPVEGNTSQIQGLWYKDGNLSKVQELDREKSASYFHLCVRP